MLFSKHIFLLLALLTFGGVLAHNSDWSINRKLEANEKIKFSLIMNNENIDTLEDLYVNISNPYHKNYGKYLTFDEINSIVNPSNNTYPDIQKQNFINDFDCIFYGDSFRCEGNVKQVENIFKVQMFEYKNKNTVISRSNCDYTLPKEYSEVKFVDGLSNYLFPLNKVKINVGGVMSNLPDYRYFGRETVNMFYNISYVPKNNVSVVAWEFMEGGYVQSNMDYSQLYNGVSDRNVSTVVGVNAPDDVETDLDLEMILNYDNVNVFYGETDGWLVEGYYDMLNLALVNKLPDIISISYGWSEYDMCQVTNCNNKTSRQYIYQSNINFLKLGLMGYTLVVSSGDAGSKGRTDELCTTDRLNPDFPGSSPYVVSVGATFTLQSNNSMNFTTKLCQNYGCATGNETIPVSFEHVGWTTGGNFDGYANASSWEHRAIDEYLSSGVYLPNSSWNRFGHGVPTLTMNGHNCPVYGANGEQTFSDVDGTSCSAPMFAGFLAYVNDFQLTNGRNKVGPAQQLLYLLAYEYPRVFMKSGHGHTYCTEYLCCSVNDGFQTPPKPTTWNPVYGLGQPNFGLMTTALNELFTK
jgi:subtilase family serine protease